MSETDLISRQAAIDAILAVTGNSSVRELYEHVQEHGLSDMWSGGVNAAIDIIIAVTSAQPETHDKRTKTHSCDCISRQDAIDAHYEYCNKHPDAGFPVWSLKILENLPSAQPEPCEDTISRKAAIDSICRTVCDNPEICESPCDEIKVLEIMPSAQPEHTNSCYTNSCYTNSWCIDCKEYDTENKCCPRYSRIIKQTLDDAYRHGETEAEARYHAQQRWIPCSERLPEERQEILATTTDNAWGDVVIIRTYYKEMHKSVIAWMPLPEPYEERRTNDCV